jgi:DNA repair exonuclease SbcCD nuclease subunit
MRILIVGDLHFRSELAYASSVKDGRQSEWEGVKSTIHVSAKSCDAVVLLGDNLNQKNNSSAVLKEFVEFLNGFGDKEIHILVGNHERQGAATALDFLDKVAHPKWFVYAVPTQTKVAGQEAMMIPFVTPALLGVETKEAGIEALIKTFPSSAIPLAFGHHAVGGSKLNNLPVELLNEIVIPQKAMEQHFSHSFCGHIHQRQHLFPSIYMTGSIQTQEVGSHSKSIWVYESDGSIDVSVEEIALPVRGIYKIVWEERNAMEEIPSNSIVKCYVTNRDTDIEEVNKFLSNFDASIVVEQYPSERAKVNFAESKLDFSVESLLKMYAEAKKVSYSDLMDGFNLIKK